VDALVAPAATRPQMPSALCEATARCGCIRIMPVCQLRAMPDLCSHLGTHMVGATQWCAMHPSHALHAPPSGPACAPHTLQVPLSGPDHAPHQEPTHTLSLLGHDCIRVFVLGLHMGLATMFMKACKLNGKQFENICKCL
jgi:hypothetical protein